MEKNILYVVLVCSLLTTAMVGIVVVKGISVDVNQGVDGQGGSTQATFTANALVSNTTLDATGTTTLTQSVDGLVVGGPMSVAASGTVVTIYTNTTGPKVCDTDIGYLHVQNNGSFAPSMTFSIGTSTTASASTNLIASTTLATTTPGTTAVDLVPFVTNRLIRLLNGDRITGIFGDNTGQGIIGGASTTNYANRAVEIGLWCQDVTI